MKALPSPQSSGYLNSMNPAFSVLRYVSVNGVANLVLFPKNTKRIYTSTYSFLKGWTTGLLVSALNSGSNSPGSGAGRGHCIHWQYASHSQCLSPQARCTCIYWIPGILNGESNHVMVWHPIQLSGRRNTPCRVMQRKPLA